MKDKKSKNRINRIAREEGLCWIRLEGEVYEE